VEGSANGSVPFKSQAAAVGIRGTGGMEEVVLSFELWILSYLSRSGARETRGTKETIEIRAQLAEILRVDGERQ